MSDKKWGHVAGPELLRRWRKAVGLTQQQAAEAVGIDLASYNAFENARERPGLDCAVQMDRVTRGKVRPHHWTADPSLESRKAS